MFIELEHQEEGIYQPTCTPWAHPEVLNRRLK